MARKAGLNGVKGWLVVLIGLIGVLVPLGQIGSFMTLLKAAPILEVHLGSSWSTYFTLVSTVIAARIIICLFVAKALIWDRRPSTPRLAVAGIWAALFLLGLVSVAVAGFYNPAPVSYSGAAVNLFWVVVICLISTVYLLRSKRVAATYGAH